VAWRGVAWRFAVLPYCCVALRFDVTLRRCGRRCSGVCVYVQYVFSCVDKDTALSFSHFFLLLARPLGLPNPSFLQLARDPLSVSFFLLRPSTGTFSSLMPVDPPHTVYQDQLTTLSHGLALWNPTPPKTIYNNVSIGDVGYLHEGTFIRMFNVTLPWDHPSNGILGRPEPYDSLDCGPFTNTIEDHFGKVDYSSRFFTAETTACNAQAVTSDE